MVSIIVVKTMIYLGIYFLKTYARNIWKKINSGFKHMKQNFKNAHALKTQY